MEKARRAILAVVLVICGFALMASAGYLARADAGGVMFGGGSDMGGNTPRKSAPPRGNFPMGNAPDDWDDEEEEEETEPIPEGESIWEDIPEDELANKERLEVRPGNYGVLEALFSFFDNTYQIVPELSPIAFPLRIDSFAMTNEGGEDRVESVRTKVYDSSEDWQEEWNELTERMRERGNVQRNNMRDKNLFIEKVEIVDLLAGDDAHESAKELGLDERQLKVLAAIREDHAGQGALVKFEVREESLTSDEVRNETQLFAMVRQEDGWKLCWLSRMID